MGAAMQADGSAILDAIIPQSGKRFGDATPEEQRDYAAFLTTMRANVDRISTAAASMAATGTKRRWSPASAPHLVEACNDALAVGPVTLWDVFMLAMLASAAVTKGAGAIHTGGVFGRIAEFMMTEGPRLEPWNPSWPGNGSDMTRLAAAVAGEDA